MLLLVTVPVLELLTKLSKVGYSINKADQAVHFELGSLAGQNFFYIFQGLRTIKGT